MQVPLCLLLAVYCAWAAQDESRAKKPIVVDAVGNTLPSPSNVPATVGSPVNLLTPDRYEFYTFDESGELVKRLMTLEEIQAIVAAGEEAEGLVTLANDKLPTSSSNYSQPPYTVLHSVVTNVKNVLKEQMEAHKTAHKKNPMFQPTLDTPDVSDSWSLILPSIFGNTGLDIVPDKTSNNITPETEMFDIQQSHPEEDDNLSKEGTNEISSSSTTHFDAVTSKLITEEEIRTTPVTTSTTTTTTTTTTTRRPTTTPRPTTTKTTFTKTAATTKASITRTTTTAKPSTTRRTTTTTTTKQPTTAKLMTTAKVSATTKAPATTRTPATVRTPTTIRSSTTIRTSTRAPVRTTTVQKETRTTTKRVPTQTTSTTSRPRIPTSTTNRPLSPSTTTTTTTAKPTTTSTVKVVRITPKVTTSRPVTTKKHTITTTETNFNAIVLNNGTEELATEKNTIQFEKVSTFVPISTAAYVTEKSTQLSSQSSKPSTSFASTTKRSVSTTTMMPSTLSSTVEPTVTTYKPSTTTHAYVSSTTQNENMEKINATTITTQSVSPSTTVSSTEFISIDDSYSLKPTDEISSNENNEPIIPLFDLAQSISQISSDLGSQYMPLPTVSNILDSSKLNDINLESKESFEMDIPMESDIKKPNVSESTDDNFVKISTLDPHSNKENKIIIESTTKNDGMSSQSVTTIKNEMSTPIPESTTMDKILSESMGDLLSQVVNEAPQIIDSDNKKENDKLSTTESNNDVTSTENVSSFSTTAKPAEKPMVEKENSENDIPKLENRVSENSEVNKNKTDSISENDKQNLAVSNEKSEIKESSTDSNSHSDPNFIKISITNITNDLSTERIITDNEIPIFNKTVDEKESNLNQTPIIVVTEVSTEKSSQSIPAKEETVSLETTTKKVEQVTEENKPQNGDVNTVMKNDKVPEFLPKIDEFKKKIQKVNIDDKEFANERNNSWKLIPTVSPPKTNEIFKDKNKNGGHTSSENGNKDIVLEFSTENQGLEVTTKDLEEDIAKFTELCNELAFRYWNAMVEKIDKRRSFVLSPYSITSMLAMMFMGARGATSGEMNDILKLDDMVTFNPHFTLKNISDSIETTSESGVIVSAFIRELYSDRSKGKILTFYKERAQHFYNGHVEEINFKLISDIIRRRTNLLVKRYTWGKLAEYMKSNTITMQPPLAAFSANIFQTDCSGSSVEGRDGEMYFVVSPNVRQRRLVPVPAVVYRSGFLAGYDPVLDATAAALGNANSIISTLFVMPGQQGNVVHAEDLETLEQRLLDANPTTPAWNRMLRTLLPRIGLELQIPRFSHKSIFNVSSTLKKMGLKDLFDAENADLGGLNGPSKDLYLSDMIQSTTFVTCGEGVIGEQHHVEEYPESLVSVARRRASRWASDWDEPRDYQRAFHDPHDVGEAMHLPLHLRPRQARLPARNAQPARLKFDRPFLYFVRHNPSGMILYVGRYNPRLLP